MFRPSTQGPDYESQVVDGEWLDADDWLSKAKIFGLENSPAVDPYVDRSEQRDASQGVHPYAAKAIWMELQKLDALPRPWHQDSFWDKTTFEVSCNLVEFANSAWSGYSMEQARSDLLAHAPVDAKWGPRDHAAKWLSAVARVGDGGRPSPDSTPDEDFATVSADVPEGLPAAFQRTVLSDLLNPDRLPREYVVEPLLAAGTSVALVAPAGSRKSLILLRIAVAVARGEESFASMEIPRARKVLYVDMENTEDDLRERLESFGITHDDDIKNFILVSLPPMQPLDTAKGGAELLAAVGAFGLEAGDLVVLDSYQRVTEAGENDSDTTRGFYRHTGMRLKERGLTVVRTDNTGKDVAKGARGSSGKRDDVDVEYLLKPDGDYVNITVGKARQRGVTEMNLYVSQKDGLTTFHDTAATPVKSRFEECVAWLDEQEVDTALGHDKVFGTIPPRDGTDRRLFSRKVVREAVAFRKTRASDFGN